MADEPHNFTTARTRLEEIVTQVRKKDTSLEKSLDLLEEGVRLANACTELIDRADWAAAGAPEAEDARGADDEPVEENDSAEVTPDAEADEALSDDEDDPVGEDQALEYDLGPDEDPAEER